MGIVSLICKQCGWAVALDDSRDVGFCSQCGTKILIQEEKINVTQNFNTTQNIVKNIYGKEKTEAVEYLQNGMAFLKVGETNKAIKAFDNAIEANPADYKAWYAKLKAITENVTEFKKEYQIQTAKMAQIIPDELKVEFDKLSKKYKELSEAYACFEACFDITDGKLRNKLHDLYHLAVLYIPEGITSFSTDAISEEYAPHLEIIYFPKSFKEFSEFSKQRVSEKISEFIVHPHNELLCSYDDMIIKGNTLIACPKYKKGSVTIPNDITLIEDSAFFGCCNLT